MSADGEIEVAVKAEGVDDAAGEMGGESLAEGDGEGGGGETGGALGGGKLLGLLGSIAALLQFMGPILDVLGIISEILTAFVAPLAVMLLRTLMPVLALMLKLLPVWNSILDSLGGDFARAVQLLSGITALFLILDLLGWVGNLIDGGFSDLVSWFTTNWQKLKTWLQNLPDKIGTVLKRLPEMLAQALSNIFPDSVSDIGNAVSGGASVVDEIGTAINNPRDTADRAGDTVVSIGGGLSAFVDEVTTDGSIDFP